MTPLSSDTTLSRPRVEGDREQEILDATLEVLGDVGYDRLTMDAVATRAKASKATLYRRWNGKVSLVIDALLSVKSTPEQPDTGNLRDDLIQSFCGLGGLTDAAVGRHLRQRHHRHLPRPGLRRGLPQGGHRAQVRAVALALRPRA